MRRADRRFRLVQELPRRRVSTAAQLAAVLGVSIRTVYRDVADLSLSGVPVLGGEAEVLAEGFRPEKGRTLDDFFAHYERE